MGILDKSKNDMKCPVCGNLTFNSKDYLYYICKECYWEYDPIQVDDLNYSGGANYESLNEYKKVYEKLKSKNHKFSCKYEKDSDLMVKMLHQMRPNYDNKNVNTIETFNYNEKEQKFIAEINGIKFETFGNLIVKINDQQIPYKSSVKRCIIDQKDEVYIEINKIEIETKNLKIKDKIDIIFDSKNKFKFYSSDEHTLIIYAKKQDSLCVFVGSDTDYSFDEAKFYNGENYCYAIKNYDSQGFHYEIVENPSEHLNWDKGHIIELRFAIVPIKSDEDMEQKLLDFFIGHA